VDKKVSDLVGLTAPASLDTLSEIASVIADSSGNRIFALDASMNLKAPLENPTFTGTVGGITATMVGLGNVTNTSDANKPVSTAQQTALDLKANIASPTFTGTVKVSSLNTSGVVHTDVSGNLSSSLIVAVDITNSTITADKLALDLDLSGNPTATTQSSSDNSTKIATTAYVKNQNYITSSSLGVMPTTEPSSPVNGSFWFNPATGNLRIYYGSFWRDFGQLS
jgi:hypothetical protein